MGWSLAAWRVYKKRAAGGGLWALVGVGGGKVAGGWPTLGMQIEQKVQLEKAELSLAGHGPRGRRKLDATEVTELACTSKLIRKRRPRLLRCPAGALYWQTSALRSP